MSLLMGELDSIARCAAQYRSERLAALGLKSCHASYLMGICDCPGISQEQLARRIYQNKSSVARQLAVLEEAGFVRRVCCDSDRRVTELYPYRAGGGSPAGDPAGAGSMGVLGNSGSYPGGAAQFGVAPGEAEGPGSSPNRPGLEEGSIWRACANTYAPLL